MNVYFLLGTIVTIVVNGLSPSPTWATFDNGVPLSDPFHVNYGQCLLEDGRCKMRLSEGGPYFVHVDGVGLDELTQMELGDSGASTLGFMVGDNDHNVEFSINESKLYFNQVDGSPYIPEINEIHVPHHNELIRDLVTEVASTLDVVSIETEIPTPSPTSFLLYTKDVSETVETDIDEYVSEESGILEENRMMIYVFLFAFFTLAPILFLLISSLIKKDDNES